MSRSRLPPTPAMSGEFIIKDHQHPVTIEGTDVFALPPAAMDSATTAAGAAPSRRSSKSGHNNNNNTPVSPVSPAFMPVNARQSVSSASGTKRPLQDFNDLPPPPTRTRKIIQMKPKTQASPAKSAAAPPAAGAGKTKDTGKGGSSGSGAAQPASKKKQPSATSAAGRKIARKTAHSLIERRRRSKMNEEFTTLKDMIPACTGQEMHKLAILQASIDYVNYLEQCIKDLKTSGHQSVMPPRLPPPPPSPTSPEFLAEMPGSEHSGSVSPELLPENAFQYHQHAMPAASPSFSPRTRMPSSANECPPSLLSSPALGPSWTGATSTNTSPALQPQSNGADVDHEASAALLMLTQDRRGTLDSIADRVSETNLDNKESHEKRRMGMSVRDLLIS